MAGAPPIRKFVKFVWGDWQTNELWQRILKTALACVIALSFAVIPELGTVYGLNTYLIPMVTVFAHPGQRMGKVIESLVMALLGSLLGLGWSLLGLFLSTLAIGQNPSAASAIRAIFMLVSVLTHGYVRSQTPRLFALYGSSSFLPRLFF
uniref:Putative ER transporter 6TM N-terminal domain-containing protein n=1 Tax=Bionectria ochroleuca TaxID=29856 RepID=A0A8H7TW97_BIOOC